MGKFYFTFGCGQPYVNGYHVIEANGWHSARDEMVRRFEKRWSMQYTEAEWTRNGITQAEEYGLHEVG